jgi:pantoate--beta-alanine ligase
MGVSAFLLSHTVAYGKIILQTPIMRRTDRMLIIDSLKALHDWQAVPKTGTRVLVPTMGNLHAGHEALMQDANKNPVILSKRSDAEGFPQTKTSIETVVSIYVNPTQFGPNEDFNAYPRTLEADLAICEKNGVDVVFAPTVAMMYPLGIDDNTRFAVDPPSSLVHRHCGIDRPGHMDGVATVVMKLFTMLRPDIAIFGQKDAQQFAILDAMVTDFGLPMRLIVHPIVRDGNGLALSSRNQYLDTPEKRDTALALFETMKGVATVVHVLPGQTIPVQKAFELSWEKTKSQYPLGDELKWEYFDAVDAETFEPIENLTPNTRLLCAARLGKARLIDNIHVNEVLA